MERAVKGDSPQVRQQKVRQLNSARTFRCSERTQIPSFRKRDRESFRSREVVESSEKGSQVALTFEMRMIFIAAGLGGG